MPEPIARNFARLTRTAADFVVLSLAYWLAFFLRFDGVPPFLMFKRLVFTWPWVVGLELAALYAFSVPYLAWRYIGLRDVERVLGALGAATGVLLVLRVVTPRLDDIFPHAIYALVPAGVIVANAVLAFLGVTGMRVLRRVLAERAQSRTIATGTRRRAPTLLIGAGEAGVMIAKEITARPDLPIHAIGFVDDDGSKLGALIHGLKVLGGTKDLAQLVHQTGAEQAIITIANAPGSQIRRIKEACQSAGIGVKIIPGIYEILGGRVNLTRIREVSIEDLLGREAVTLDLELIREFLTGKRVLVTGAGGSIGSELCRQVARFGPAQLALVEQAEFNLFSIHQELLGTFPELDMRPLICDVCDSARLEAIFAELRPEVVFHAAAHKHVPMMEWNPGEAIKNNVFGTKKVADAADRHGAEAFVLISTDKAVNPTSIMGASKRLAEMYVQALSAKSRTKFVAVRFGNVLGSTGSVVPIFKAQIAAGGPVHVTHPDMMRYFLTIPEASQLVMQASAMGASGEIMLLDMGEPMRIVELAEELIRLSGLEPHTDVEIKFTGVRPGEKLFEELSFDAEKMSKTRHDQIFVGKLQPERMDAMLAKLERLSAFTSATSRGAVRAVLREVVPEMRQPDETPVAPPAPAETKPVAEAAEGLRPAVVGAE